MLGNRRKLGPQRPCGQRTSGPATRSQRARAPRGGRPGTRAPILKRYLQVAPAARQFNPVNRRAPIAGVRPDRRRLSRVSHSARFAATGRRRRHPTDGTEAPTLGHEYGSWSGPSQGSGRRRPRPTAGVEHESASQGRIRGVASSRPAPSLTMGIRARTVVPAPRALASVSRPPSASTRSLRPRSPLPSSARAPPTPSSATAISAQRSSPCSVDLRGARLGVLGDVRQRLGGDEVQRRLVSGRQAAVEVGVEHDRHR